MKKLTLAILVTHALITLSTTLAQRVYFGSSNSKGIYFADFNADSGTLSIPKLAIEADGAGFITLSPDEKCLYSTGVASFKINPDGSLAQISSQQTGEKGSCQVSTDQTGKMLMTAYYSSGSVASFKVGKNGSLSEAVSLHRHEGKGEHPHRQKKAFGHSIFPNPANTHAYAADLGADKVFIYKMNPEAGSLTPAGEAVVPGGAMGPRHMKWNADGSLLYVLNELDLSVSIFSAEADGQLKFIKTESVLPEGSDKEKMTCAEIRIHPNGKWIYTSNRDLTEEGRDSMTVFSRHEDGFKRIETVSAEVWIPRNFNIDPTGKWLLVGGQKSNNIAIFKIDPTTGRLTFTDQKVPFEGGPICIEFLSD
jgi:6-phosphogluconolactonase